MIRRFVDLPVDVNFDTHCKQLRRFRRSFRSDLFTVRLSQFQGYFSRREVYNREYDFHVLSDDDYTATERRDPYTNFVDDFVCFHKSSFSRVRCTERESRSILFPVQWSIFDSIE